MYDSNHINGLLEVVGAVGLVVVGLTLSNNFSALSGMEPLVAGFAIYAFGLYATETNKALARTPNHVGETSVMMSGIIMTIIGTGLGLLVALGQVHPLIVVLTIPLSAKFFKATLHRMRDLEEEDKFEEKILGA